MTQDNSDRRRNPRVRANFRVQFETLDQLVMAYTKNLSKGGMFIRTDHLLPVNAVVRLVFQLPGGDEVSCISRIVRTLSSEKKKGIAVEFMDVSADSLERIERFISQAALEGVEDSGMPELVHRLKILVVDDDWMYREQAVEALQERGHEVTAVEDGLQALGACLRDPPDLVLSDVQMPRMDGWNFLRTIRARPSLAATRVIFQTTLGGEKDRLKGYQMGVDDYLAKPYTPEELVLRIERLYERSISGRSDGARKALRGDLAQVSLATVLSMLELEQKTGVLMLVGPAICHLFVRDGRPMAIEVDGVPDDSDQMSLVARIFGWTEGQFEFAPHDVVQQDRLKTSMQGLLMEAARLVDEAGR